MLKIRDETGRVIGKDLDIMRAAEFHAGTG